MKSLYNHIAKDYREVEEFDYCDMMEEYLSDFYVCRADSTRGQVCTTDCIFLSVRDIEALKGGEQA